MSNYYDDYDFGNGPAARSGAGDWDRRQTGSDPISRRLYAEGRLEYLGEGTLNTVRATVANNLAGMWNKDTASRQALGELAANPGSLEDLTNDAAWILSFRINSNTIKDDVRQEDAIMQVVMESLTMRIVAAIDADRRLLVHMRQAEPERFDLYATYRESLLALMQHVKDYRTRCRSMGLDYRGPLNGGQHAPAQPINNGYVRPSARAFGQVQTPPPAPVYQPTSRHSAPDPVAQMMNKGTVPGRPAGFVEGYDSQIDLDSQYDDTPSVAYDPNAQPQPARTMHRRTQPDQYETVHRDTSGNRINDIFAEAQTLAEQEFPDNWESPVTANTANSELMTEDAAKYGPVTRERDYHQMRLSVWEYAEGCEWAKSIDRTRTARRCMIVDGVFTETLVPMDTLTVSEIEYLQLEASPTARRRAIDLQERLDIIADKQPIIIESIYTPTRKDIKIQGVNRPMELCIIDKNVVASSIDAAEAMASVSAIAQTGKDINQNDAVAFFAEVISYHGTYTNDELDALESFLDTFSIDAEMNNSMGEYVTAMTRDKDNVPPRVWNYIDQSITVEANKWLSRILRPEHRGTCLDSFTADFQQMCDWMLSKGYTKEFIEGELAATGAEWVHAMRCLKVDRTGETSHHLRIDLASVYDRREYVAKAYALEDAHAAKRLAESERIRGELAESESKLTDEEFETLVMKRIDEVVADRTSYVREEESVDAYWMNHSVFSYKAHVMLRVPSNMDSLGLSRKGYTHANDASNPAINKVLDSAYSYYGHKLIGMRNLTMILDDGHRVNVVKLGNGRSGYLLEVQ